jgi:hypothetical protein
MVCLWKKEFRIHRAASVAVVLLYTFVVSAVDLFHNEKCQLAPSDTAHKDVIPNGDQCPACTFLAGHSSTGADYEPAVISPEYLVISLFMPREMFVPQKEWAHSIASRAPPSTDFS